LRIGWLQGIMRGSARDDARAVRRFWSGHQPWTAAAGVALVGVGAAVLITWLSGSSHSGHELAGAQPAVASSSAPADGLAKLQRATTFTSIPAAPLDPNPFAVTSGLVMHPLTPQVVYAAPGKPPIAVLPATELGAPTWVPVVQSSPRWDRVLLPSRPNRATGWIFTGGTAGSQLEIRRSAYLIRIETGARKLIVDDDGRSLGTWTVAVGAPGTPTPTGRTFLLALLAPPHPTYSPLILPLGVHSNAFSTFGGGPGTVGLHGWPDPSVFGHAISNGCVRVPPAALHVLSGIPLGTLVLITRLASRAGLEADTGEITGKSPEGLR
jgi:lipoprotein-anchoring transpeptidase ErfK/SrfK